MYNGDNNRPNGLQALSGQMLPDSQAKSLIHIIAHGTSEGMHSGRRRRINKYVSEAVDWGGK